MKLEATSLSRPGVNTTTNGDAVLADVSRGVFAVADGVGGSGCDDVASRTAIDYVATGLADRLVGVADDAVLEVMRDVFAEANTAVRAEADRRRNELGTTLTAVVVRNQTAYLAHSGDSRVYQVGDRGATPLTDDHTFVADMVRDGLLDPDDARQHPRRHLLSACLGLHEKVKVQTRSCPLAQGQVWVLCTDGVSDVVSGDEIAACVQGGGSADAVARRLLDTALAHGGTDDLSVVVVRAV